MSVALIDTDVLYKMTVYGLLLKLLQSKPFGAETFHVLGAAQFMIPRKLKKYTPSRGSDTVLAEFKVLLPMLGVLEPTEEEIALAGQLEYLARQQNLPLDSGESQLCAVLITRKYDLLFTGDKRAITAIGKLLADPAWQALAGKVVCLEQLFQFLVGAVDHEAVRSVVCVEKAMDRAVGICFACHAKTWTLEAILDGLGSYVNSLRQEAPNVLYAA